MKIKLFLVMCSLLVGNHVGAVEIEPDARLGDGVDQVVADMVVKDLLSLGFICDSVSELYSMSSPARFYLSCNNDGVKYIITHQGNNHWNIDFAE